jgi:hypothetical protein
VENFCASVKPGEARLADCLSKQQDEETKGNTEGVPTCVSQGSYHAIHSKARGSSHVTTVRLLTSYFAGKTLTDDCKKELSDFRIELGESVNRNLPLGEDYMPPF